MRKTKIIVSVGRIYNSDNDINRFIDLGADILRTNLSHQDHPWHDDILKRMRNVIEESGKDIKIEADISGPKVRTGDNPKDNYWIPIREGESIVLTTGDPEEGKVHLPFPKIHGMVERGSMILIDDAAVQLKVMESKGHDIVCESILDCKLGGNRTVVVPGKDMGLPTITEKDWSDLEFIAKHDVIDYLGFSMVKTTGDVKQIKDFFASKNADIKVISKIETPEGVKNFDGIMMVSDAIMIARGDMGVFLPIETVPAIQYEIIRKCRGAGKFVIVATEMLHSMKNSPTPSRAEVNDIYTAVSAGADCVFLSGETTEGKFPFRCVDYMRRIVEEAEKNPVRIM